MFTRNKENFISKDDDLSTYIDGVDVFNSVLLDKIRDAHSERVPYEIRTFEYRPDLICEELYNDVDLLGLFMLSCGVSLSDLKKGAIIQVLPRDVLIRILKEC
jgi:hypothetical protein